MVSVWLFIAALVVCDAAICHRAWLYYRKRRRMRPTDDKDFAIGADEDVILIRLDRRGLPTMAQGKGIVPAQTMAACYIMAHNIAMQLSADIARTADFPPPDAAAPDVAIRVAEAAD